MTESAITLYSFRRCPFAIRVRLTLHLKSIAFIVIEESLKNMSDDLKRLHPEAKVPLLLDGKLAVYESSIITEYLNDKFPSPQLMPESAEDRMRVREWTYWCNQLFKPQIDQVKYKLQEMKSDDQQIHREKLTHSLRRIDQALSDRNWLVGDQMTLADVHVFPFFRQVVRAKPAVEGVCEFKNAQRWYESITSTEAFVRTMAK